MELDIVIKPEIKIIDGETKYFYGNLEFDTYADALAYIQGLNTQTIQSIASKFDSKIHTQESAGLNNQHKTNEIQEL